MTSRQRGSRRHRARGSLALAVLVPWMLVLAACGSGDDGGSSDAGGSPGSTAPQEDASTRDPDGVVEMGYDLQGTASGGFWLDPAEIPVSITNSALLRHIYGTFLRPTSDGDLVPDLAESTDVPDDSTIVISLRDGVTFSDGSPFDAEAVKAGLERTLADGDPAGLGDGFANLQSVEATDPQTVTLTIADGTAQAWHDEYIGSWQTTIVKPGDDFTMPTGAGPFEVTEYAPGESMTLIKRTDHWDADSILIAGIDVTQVLDSQAAVSALGADQIDMARIDPAQADGLSGGDGVLFEPNPDSLMSLQICKSEPPLDDADARRALQLAIDAEGISDALYAGAYEPARGLWPVGHPFHDPANEDAITFDPEAARQALADAGVPDGFEVDVYVLPAAGLPEVAEILQAQWADIGVTANLVPAANYVQDYLVASAPGLGLIPVMGTSKSTQWSGDTTGNACGYADPEMDALAAQVGSASGDELAQAWQDMEALVVEDALNVLLMFGGATTGYSSEKLGNAAVEPDTLPMVDPRTTFVRG